MKRVIVLGSTGSIGVQALQVLEADPDFKVVGLSCKGDVALIAEQAHRFGVDDLAVSGPVAPGVEALAQAGARIREGEGAPARLVHEVDADIVLNAIVGFAGLESSLAALEKGCTLALANKESLVCAGGLVNAVAARTGGRVLPVDSEHSALFQLIEGAGEEGVDSVVITASGGPFLGKKKHELRAVTPEEAVAHPTWSMGRKISVDSATLMNKGLEVIEAHHLFSLPYEKIEVTVHPQSIVHGLVRMVDGALLAHLGVADMRVPIAYALRYPLRGSLEVPTLDFGSPLSLEFTPPDEDTFPAVRLSRQAGGRGDRATCALNAANEVAVSAFLEGRLPFSGITEVVAQIVAENDGGGFGTYEEVVDVDIEARMMAEAIVEDSEV